MRVAAIRAAGAATLAVLNAAAWAQPVSAARELIQRGGCVACHGVGLSTPGDPATPRLAGQHADYLNAAMRAYQRSDNARVGRSHPAMQAVLQPFSPAELEAMARYIEQLPGDLHTRPQPGLR